MKSVIKIIGGFALIGSLFSCNKDNIEVINNLDTSWEVSQSIKDNDLRNRFGFDPRYNYILSETNEYDIPMFHLGGLPITGSNTQNVEIKLLKPIEKDLTVSLKYDEALFEKVKAKYSGFRLGAEDLIKLSEKQKVIPAGTTSINFEFVVANDPNFENEVIVPFSLHTEDKDIKLLEGKEYFIAKIFAKEIELTYPNRITKKLIVTNPNLFPADVPIQVEMVNAISDPIVLSLQRIADNSSLNLAPDGAEGQLPSDKTFEKGVAKFPLLLDVSNLEEGDIYQLPLQIVATLGGKSYTLPRTVTIILDASTLADENIKKVDKATGTRLSENEVTQVGIEEKRFGFLTITPFNNRYNIGLNVGNDDITLNFNSKRMISSLAITNPIRFSSNQEPITNIDIYAVDSKGDEVFLSSIEIDGKTRETIIGFSVPVSTERLILKNFGQSEVGKYFALSKLDVYAQE